jgi:hypothetical protein
VALTVVTDLTPQEASAYIGQLRALEKLLDLGVQVRSLSRLHANVLLVDGTYVIAGSQNFTTYARQSKEATAVPPEDLSGSRFVQRLNEWLRASEVVDQELIDHLLKDIKAVAKAATEAEEVLQLAVVDSLSRFLLERAKREHEERERKARITFAQFSRERLFALRSAKSTRLAHGDAFIQRSSAGDWFNPYTTFKADSNTDLTSWVVTEPSGDVRLVNLDPFDWYPILMTGSGRMTRARVVKTRITYVKDGVNFTQTREVDNSTVSVKVTFPLTLPSGANVVMTLTETPVPYVACQMEALFDGESFVLLGIEQTGQLRGPGYGDSFEEACRGLFDDSNERDKLFRFVFRDIRFSETEIRNHNASNYFQGDQYRLSLLEYADTPVLLAHRLL